MKKGEEIQYLGFTVKMSLNNDGIVLLSPKGDHLGNFGISVSMAKKYALSHYMMSKPRLHPCLTSRLINGRGHWGDHSLLAREMKADGLTDVIPKTQDGNFSIDFSSIK